MSPKVNVEEKVAANLYSSHDVLKAMNEFLEEGLPQAGYTISMKWVNLRLAVMFLACSAAMYGQFGTSFPKDGLKLTACVVTYFILSGTVTAIDYLIMKSANVVLKDSTGNLFVGLAMKRSDSHVTLTIRQGLKRQEFRLEIDKLFDSDGVLIQSAMLNAFSQNLGLFKNKDKKKD